MNILEKLLKKREEEDKSKSMRQTVQEPNYYPDEPSSYHHHKASDYVSALNEFSSSEESEWKKDIQNIMMEEVK